MRSVEVTIIISVEHSQPSIPSTALYIFLALKFTPSQFFLFSMFQQNTSHHKQTSYRNSYVSRVPSIILKWEQPLKAATFSQKDFFQNT